MKLWVKISLWLLLFTGVILVLYFGNEKEMSETVKAPLINIKVNGPDTFLTDQELILRLKNESLLFDGQVHEKLNIKKIESFVLKMPEVRRAQVYKRINNDWNIEIELIKPIARIFNNSGETYYLDADGKKMKRSDLHTARILVFTGNIHDKFNTENAISIINNDSLKSIRDIDDIFHISNYVCNDPLLQSLIGQVYLNENKEFIMIPVLGDQKIVFGKAHSAKQVREKFQRLKVFYKEAIPYEGWSKYSEISLKYEGQIVCKRVDSE